MTRPTLTRIATVLLAGLLLCSTLVLTGCNGMTDAEFLDLAAQKLAEFLNQDSEDAEEGADGPVTLALTYPIGRSPKVFVTGWIFGAKASATDEDGEVVDLSESVTWSGSGSFSPDTGNRSKPAFDGAGGNTIKLSVVYEGKTYTKEFTVEAVSTADYARKGDLAECLADGHGSPGCPLVVVGPITTGSPNVFIDGMPAARVGDVGVHAACAGPNTFEIAEGDDQVLINGRAAARIGSMTQHCGGVGRIKGGSGS